MNTSNTNSAASHPPLILRRKFITLAAAGGFGVAASLWGLRNSAQGKLFTEPGRFADELTKTPVMAEGPFYPDKLPLDTDNDLLILNDAITPVTSAFVEIWQVDNGGVYLHSRSAGAEKRDTNFQGYGRFLTNRKGEYYFRTIQPVSYPGRVPHIHFAVSLNGHRILTTQMLTRGHADNAKDGLFRRFKDEQHRNALTAEYKPIPESKLGELEVRFDLVLGVTPDENAPITGGIAKPTRR